MERVFSLLEETNSKASFFILGWIGEKYPEVVREICKRGFEIGSHTNLHQLVYEQTKEEFYQDVNRSVKTLEDISGKKVRMFRAPGFSITEKNKWAFEVLCDLGIEIDSSVFPAARAHGGMPSYGTSVPSILQYKGIELKEFPINTHQVLGRDVIYSGGGYFRILPYSIIKNWTEKDEYVMSYIHPRDLDPNQPMIKDLSYSRKFKSYVGLKKAEYKLKRWITDFDFIDVYNADSIIDWNNVRKITL
jgi:polysaccharide deacetylase family protein (PEP-CTERM system associated)